MAGAWCLLLLLLGVVRQQGPPGVRCEGSEEGLTLERWTAAIHAPSSQPQDTPQGEVDSKDNKDGEEEEEAINAEDKNEKDTGDESKDEYEGGTHEAMESVSDTAPAATSRMLLVEEEEEKKRDASAEGNVTNIRDLLTWRLKDTSLLDELTNKIIGSGEDLETPKGGSAKGSLSLDDEPSPKKASGGSSQAEAASKVVETRVAAPAQYAEHPGGPACDPQKSLTCLSTDETLELRQQLLQDLQTSFNAPLPSRIRYRLKKKPSIYAIYTSKKPSTRFDIGIPDIYETEVMVSPKHHRQQPFSRKPGVGKREEVFGFAADRKFQHYVLPQSPKYVPIEALVTPSYSETPKESVTKPYIPLNKNHDANQSGLVFRPPRRPPGSQKRRTNGLLRRPTSGEPHYFTPAPERLSLQAHLQYRRPVSFRYSRTKASPKDDDSPSTTPLREIHTTQPHPSVSLTSPRPTAAVTATSHHHQGSSPAPTEGYSTKAAGYSKPSDHYLTPEKEYEAPVTPQQQPKTNYSPPAGDYTEPPQKYETPSKEYIAPETPHKPDAHSQPPRKYLPPNKEYEAPESESQHPAEPHTEPPRKYLPPNREYEPPKSGHKAPSQAYEQPSRHYRPPNREYMAPPKRPHPLAMGHMAPGMGIIAQPPRKYLPPDKEFGSHRKAPGSRRPLHHRRRPSKRRRKNKKRPTPPSRHYLLPNKNYEGGKVDAKPHPGTPPSRTYPTPDKNSPHPSPPAAAASHITKVPLEYNTPPSRTYEPPSKEYIPPKSDDPKIHSDSLMMTTMSSIFLTSPARTYVPPQFNYQTPRPAYQAPPLRYHPPIKEYIPPKPGPHGPVLPSWLMSIQKGQSPPVLEENLKGYNTNPTPPPGYHPDHSMRLDHSPSTRPAAGYDPHHRQTVYQPPGATYHPPEPTHHPPESAYHTPEPVYHPPEERPSHPVPTPNPEYLLPARTYEPPIREYLRPDTQHLAVTPGPAAGAYVPPGPPGPPVRDYKISTPKPSYVPPPPPPLHLPIDPNYLPPPRLPSATYIPPYQEYLAPASYVGPTAAALGTTVGPTSPPPDYVPPSEPEPGYVPPVTPKPHFTTITITPLSTATPKYVPPASPRPDYVPPASPKPDYVPPETSTAPHHHPSPAAPPSGYHVTTYKPSYDDNLQKLQDFSYPGSGRVSPLPPRPSLSPRYNTTTYAPPVHTPSDYAPPVHTPTDYAPPVHTPTTYAPPVYTPSTYGPGYNDLTPGVKTAVHAPTYPQSPYQDDYDDDDYYYYYYYDDDDYSYDDDYYYYYDDYDYDYDYDYGPYRKPLRRPVPHHLIPQHDYHIDDSEVLDFGYIAGIPGRAGRDYPILSYIPLTSFGCDLVADYPGYYADMEAGCQVFHICHRNGRQDSFLCPNGTVFNQKYFVCDWWYNFACEDAPFFYPVNAAIGHPGVPLHKNAFEPDLHAIHQLPPRRHPQHQPLHHATRPPLHRATAVPTHQATPSPSHHPTAAPTLHHSPQHRITILPRLGHLPDSSHTSQG